VSVSVPHCTLEPPGKVSALPVPLPGTGQVSALPVPLPGPANTSVYVVSIPGIDPVSATPIEIPGKGSVAVVAMDTTGRVSALPIPLPGPEGISVTPVLIPGLDPVSATPIEIPGTGQVSALPVPLPGTGQVSSLPIPLPSPEGASVVPIFIDGIDPVSATPIEIPGKKRAWVLAMSPILPGDPRILRGPSRPLRIIGIGSSMGADAVVSACNENCIGALSLSPGSWLGIKYSNSVAASNMLVWCVAANGDVQAANTCRNASGDQYQDNYLPGGAHGTDMFKDPTGHTSPLGQLIYNFILELGVYQQ